MRAEAEVAQRRAAWDSAEAGLARTKIVSPIDGTVVSRRVEMGQPVEASSETPLFLIAPDLSVVLVDANVGANDIGEIKPGDKASFTVDALPGRVFNGEVREIHASPQKDEEPAAYDIVISAPNPDLALAPGMRVTAEIIVARRDDVTRVPNRALRYLANMLGAGDLDGEKPPADRAQLWGHA